MNHLTVTPKHISESDNGGMIAHGPPIMMSHEDCFVPSFSIFGNTHLDPLGPSANDHPRKCSCESVRLRPFEMG